MIAVMVSQRGRLVNCFYFLSERERERERVERKTATREKGRPVSLFKMKDARVQRRIQSPPAAVSLFIGVFLVATVPGLNTRGENKQIKD